MRPLIMPNKLRAIRFIINNRGILYFFKRYILKELLRILHFGPKYIALCSVEFCLPARHKRKYSLPEYLQLEPTSRCNMKCRNCTRDMLSQFGDLKLDDFFYIIKQFPFLKKVKLQGLGEPLLNDSLFKMASFLKQKNITTYIAINGTLVTKDIARDLAKYFDKVEISIDSPHRNTFENIRGGDCMEEILRGARLLQSVNKDSDIAINFVLDKENVKELVPMVKLVRNLHINHINIVSLQNWISVESKHQDRRKEILQRTIKEDRNVEYDLKEARKLAKSFNIYLDFSDSNNQKGRCFWYKKGLYISWNGYVTPCCIRPNYEEFNFGNVFKRKISDIWNSPKYVNFRQQLNVGEVPAVCKGCSYA